MDFNTLLKYIYNQEDIISKIKSYDETIDIELQWPSCNLIVIDNQIFLPYKEEISLQNINRLLQWTIGKILIFYYNHNDIIDEIKVIKRIVHVFITRLRTCVLKYENNNEVLCEKNVNLMELISLFHYSCLFVDNVQIEDIINKGDIRSYIRLHNIIYHDMVKYKNNNFIYINNMTNDFHVEYFKNIIMNSKRFLSLLLLTCNEKYSMNINEDCLIEQLNIIRNKLNIYNVKLPIFGLAGLNYVIYQDKKKLTEPTWSKIMMDTRLLVNLIHEFFYIFIRSYSNDFSYGISHRVESLEDGYFFEKQIFGTIKYNFWYDDSCCQLILDKNTWSSSINNCLFTNDILTKLEDIPTKNQNFCRDNTNIQFFGIEYVRNNKLTYE
ncbi:unnamed protein product [Rotaria sp. Silwood2]|nr:unnamed protein product [Rotaria sp. Silwood2]CAF4571103.1 unnamed protein product [Rotaria sp. Silwood2]